MDKMPATTNLFRLLWLLGLAAATKSPQCGNSVSSTADASLTKWIQDTEANVSTGSYHVVLGGDRAAHGTALKCALRTAAKAAGAPPSAFSSILTIDCEGDDCADASWDSVAAYLKKRRGKYGVIMFQQDAPLARALSLFLRLWRAIIPLEFTISLYLT